MIGKELLKLKKFLAVAGIEDPTAAASFFKAVPKLDDDVLQGFIKADSQPPNLKKFLDLMEESKAVASDSKTFGGDHGEMLYQISKSRENDALKEISGRSDYVKLRNKLLKPKRKKK